MNDLQANHSRSEIFHSPDNLETIENNVYLAEPETYSLSYESINKENLDGKENIENTDHIKIQDYSNPEEDTSSEIYVNLSQDENKTDKSNEEEIHNVTLVVTIAAAFPAGFRIFQLLKNILFILNYNLKDSEKESMFDAGTNKPRATEGPKPQVIKDLKINKSLLNYTKY